MKLRLTLLLFVCSLIAVAADAAMVRVVHVQDARTIVVEDRGTRSTVTLAGIEITDPVGARTLLEWTLASSFVMVEARPGGFLVYRSPDVLMINRELVLRGYARATLTEVLPPQHVAVTFLGTLDLGVPSRTAGSAGKGKVSSGTGSGSGRSARPSAPRRPRSRGRSR